MSEQEIVTILHVDDNEANRYIVARMLRKAGFELKEAATGKAGLRLAVEQQPDLIILDVQLPDINGFEVCRRIKANPATSSIPVIHLSGSFVKSEDKVQGLEGGADGYLAQPVEPIELIATVNALLRIRQAEESALALAREWQTTFDAIGDAVCLLDWEGRVLRCNSAMTNLLRKPLSEIKGQFHQELMQTMLGSVEVTPFTRVQKIHRRESMELQFGERWFSVTTDPVFGTEGAFTGAVYILTNITDRKRAEEALQKAHAELEIRVENRTAELRNAFEQLQSEIIERQRAEEALRLLESAVQQAHESIVITSAELNPPDPKIVFVNPAFTKLTGYTADEVIGKTPRILQGPKTEREVVERLHRSLEQGQTFYGETINYRKDGSEFYMEWHVVPIRNESREITHFVGIQRDSTSRKRTEQAIQESQIRLKLINSISTGMMLNRSVEQIIERTVKQISRFYNTVRVAYSTINDQGNLTVVRSIEPQGMPQLKGLVVDLTVAPEYLNALRMNEPVIVKDVARDVRLASLAGAMLTSGTQALINVPFSHPENLVGLLCFESPQSRNWSKHEISTLTGIVQYISIIIKNAHAQQERKRAEEALQKAHDELEIRVKNRTAELAKANEELRSEITERKQAEEALRQSEEQIKASLQEKEVLLKEIHHRVKNNMQVICSLLNLQSGSIEDSQTLELLQEAQNRVASMALVHEQLYQSEDLARIDFAEYIQNLAANLLSSYDVNSDAIALKINVEHIHLSVDAAIPCGLIINELVANSLKYAFPSGKSGEIRIALHSDNNNQLLLSVSDNGIGLPSDFDIQNTETLGLQLVTALTGQLSGSIELNRNLGTEFKITFPEKEL